jgi:hypothetical protein
MQHERFRAAIVGCAKAQDCARRCCYNQAGNGLPLVSGRNGRADDAENVNRRQHHCGFAETAERDDHGSGEEWPKEGDAASQARASSQGREPGSLRAKLY